MFTIDVNDVDSIIVDVQTSSQDVMERLVERLYFLLQEGKGRLKFIGIWGELTPFDDSSVVLNNLNAGNYSVTIIDSINCTATANFIIDTLEFTVVSQLSIPSCTGESDGSISTSFLEAMVVIIVG